MGSCCSTSEKKKESKSPMYLSSSSFLIILIQGRIPQEAKAPEITATQKIQIEIAAEKDVPAVQKAKIVTEQMQSLESVENKRPEGLMTSPISARRPPHVAKKTTDITHQVFPFKNEPLVHPPLKQHASGRTKQEYRRAGHESLAVGGALIQDSSVLQASINAQRKNSVSLARRKLSQKTGFPEQTLPQAEEEEKSDSNLETAENSQERAMLLRYVFSWSDLASAYQQESYFAESLDCIESAALIYERLLMYPHLSLCLGQFFLGKVKLR